MSESKVYPVKSHLSDSALLEASQQELRQVLAERPYRCPIPAEVSPSVLR